MGNVSNWETAHSIPWLEISTFWNLQLLHLFLTYLDFHCFVSLSQLAWPPTVMNQNLNIFCGQPVRGHLFGSFVLLGIVTIRIQEKCCKVWHNLFFQFIICHQFSLKLIHRIQSAVVMWRWNHQLNSKTSLLFSKYLWFETAKKLPKIVTFHEIHFSFSQMPFIWYHPARIQKK